MKKLFVAIGLCVGLAGCELQPSAPYPALPAKQWYKDGATKADARKHLATCKYNVGMNNIPELQQFDLIQNCMMKDGFEWTYNPDDKAKWDEQVNELKKQGYRLY